MKSLRALYEQETLISFNREESIAYIFTYDQVWQRHLEDKLKLKPVSDNGFGGREYEIEKKRIPKPRALRKLSAEQRKALAQRLNKVRSKPKPVLR